MGKIHEDYANLLKLNEEKPKEKETIHITQEFLQSLETCDPTLLESVDEFGQTLLHKCVMANDIVTLLKILPRIKDINTKDGNNCSALYYALLLKKDRMICPLIEHGADINEKDIAGYTYLHHATIAGDVKKIKLLLNSGANLLIKDGLEQSLLQRITTNSTLTKEIQSEIINIFLNYGAGLYCDLTNIELPPECYNNALLINAIQNNVLLDNTVENFDKSIFSVDQLQNAIKRGMRFDYKYLLLMTNYLIESQASKNQSQEQDNFHSNPQTNISDEEISPQINMTELIRLRDSLPILVNNQDKISSLRQKIIKDIAKKLIIFTPEHNKALEKIPDLFNDLQLEIAKEEKRVKPTINQNKK